MTQVLVSLPSGAGVLLLDDGSIAVSDDARGGGSGTLLRQEDRFHPAKAWVDEDHCVVGGLLPPGAVSADVVDDQGTRVAAAVGQGAYVAVLEQPNDGHEPIVCCRDPGGEPVRRPWAGDYPSARVTDAEEPCPACGAIDYDEYEPFEQWRGGRGRPDGTMVPNPVVSCRVCGHEEPGGTFLRSSSELIDGVEESIRAERIARAREDQRKRRWTSTGMTLRETRFPIYAASGWTAEMGGSGSQGGRSTEITINHYDKPDFDPFAGDLPRLTITTKSGDHFLGALHEARWTLGGWVGATWETRPWPKASDAAITVWLRARDRQHRAAVVSASRSDQMINLAGEWTSALMLETPMRRWVAVARHSDLTIVVAAYDVDLASLRLEPIADPVAQLLGPKPSDT